jgi:acetyl-CoA carboxylase biotin carboxyl carrier protein
MKEMKPPRTVKSEKKPWIDINNLKSLIDLIKDTDVSELEIEKGGVRVKIRKSLNSPSTGLRRIQEAVSASIPSAAMARDAAPPVSEAIEDKYSVVCSPIVGTFFRSSSPGAEPYVNVGDTVKKGQILCIVEAMKLMNEIESEVDGNIVEIMVDDSQPVEYGETLFKIEPVS